MKRWDNLSAKEAQLVASVLGALQDHLKHYESVIDDAAVEAGILWRCVCGWLNRAGAESCQAGDGCPGMRKDNVP